jgi:hypothetical protein
MSIKKFRLLDFVETGSFLNDRNSKNALASVDGASRKSTLLIIQF